MQKKNARAKKNGIGSSVQAGLILDKLMPYILLALIVLAMIIGAWFYYDQLSATPMWLWIFVPDCPIYAALMAGILLFDKPRNEIYRFVVACASALYGTWTVFVILLYKEIYFADTSGIMLSIVMIIGHIGMIAGAFLILPKKRSCAALIVAFFWLMANTYADYKIGNLSTHPWIPTCLLQQVAYATAALFILWPALLYLMQGMVAKNKAIDKLREKLRLR